MLFFYHGWLTDVGFQIPFFATTGILFLKSIFDAAAVQWHLTRVLLFDDLEITCTAQLATTPILLANLGFFNPLSILINLLILWTVPPFMLFGHLAALGSYLFVPLAQLFVWLSYPLLWYFASVVMWMSSLQRIWTITHISVTMRIG